MTTTYAVSHIRNRAPSVDPDIQLIAEVCHEANRALQRQLGEVVNFPWESTSEEMRSSIRIGVVKVINGATLKELHDSWVDTKISQGWTYGPVKDFAEKEHPLLVPYSELPAAEALKDRVFHAIVTALTQG